MSAIFVGGAVGTTGTGGLGSLAIFFGGDVTLETKREEEGDWLLLISLVLLCFIDGTTGTAGGELFFGENAPLLLLL
jgi:hypothetical protein